MRVLISADLHYRPRERESFLAFADWVVAQQPDCFILAGDVGHPLRLFRRGLQLFRDLTCPRLLVTGNHDLYRGEHDSRTLWESHLAHAAADEGFIWLEQQNFSLGRVGICGTMAWYDYSSRPEHMALDHATYHRLKPLVSHDADYVNWPWSDRAMARFLGRRFAHRLGQLHAEPRIEQILVVTHMPIFRAAIPDQPASEFWSLLQAYMGNLTLGQMVRRHPKVTHVVSGHIHRHGQWTVAGEHRAIECHSVGSPLMASRQGAPAAVLLTL